MFDKFKVWFFGLGPFLYELVTSIVGGFVKKYGPRALEIVIQVATMPGTGPEKFAKATELLMAEVPGMTVWAANTVIQNAYAVYMARQEKIDTDGDGVPDYRDMCKELGAPPGGCVTKDGCPDSDCDGVPDEVK
jgi:hypothetical protein